MYSVIDGDEMERLETFTQSQRDQIFEKYNKLKKYEDVAFDSEGDLIVFEKL